jgi:hypothetical protein
LIFLPNESKRLSTSSGFIWSAAENSGYALNEPLQAFAPVTSTNRVTNVIISATAGPAERIGGHETLPAEVAVTLTDGSPVRFQIWRASDLDHLPLRISAHTLGGPVTLTLSDIRLELPPQQIFTPPDGFSKYPSVLAMRDELLRRSSSIRKPYTGPPEFRDLSKQYEDQMRQRY